MLLPSQISLSPGKVVVEGENVISRTLNSFSQCVATIIAFSFIQKERHRNLPYALPMLSINPEGVTVIAYDINKDTLLVSDNCRWGKVAFLVVWLVLHYSLFPSSGFQ